MLAYIEFRTHSEIILKHRFSGTKTDRLTQAQIVRHYKTRHGNNRAESRSCLELFDGGVLSKERNNAREKTNNGRMCATLFQMRIQSPQSILTDCPPCYSVILHHIDSLAFEDFPDYNFCARLLYQVLL